MFSGIINAVTRISAVDSRDSGKIIRLDTPYEDVASDESIAINGVCLTATERTAIAAGMRIDFFCQQRNV